MDSYAGTLDNPISLHKYLYANANPVMYTDPTGNFSLAELNVTSAVRSTLDGVIVPFYNMKKIMSWANLAVTIYDVAGQVRLILSGEANILGLALAIGKGMLVQSLLNCAAKAVLGEAAATVLKVIGIAQDTESFIEAVKSGDPEKIIVESIRLSVSVFTLQCQCFTGDTLVSTEDGYRRIDELEIGDYVWAYNTETGERELKEVLATPVTQTDILVHLTLSDGEEIETTMFHPFFVQDEACNGSGRWSAASNLVSGDVLLMEDGKSVYVLEVRIEKLDEEINVYNLEVDEWHTYFVAGGVLVHNTYDINGTDVDSESDTTTKPNQVHHYATNKSKTYTPQLEEIANRYGLDLDDAWNKDLLPHQGRHPNAYHEYVLDSMKQFDNIAQGDKDIFLKLFDNLKNNVKSNPDMLYKDYWK